MESLDPHYLSHKFQIGKFENPNLNPTIPTEVQLIPVQYTTSTIPTVQCPVEEGPTTMMRAAMLL